jgi:Formyl transferase
MRCIPMRNRKARIIRQPRRGNQRRENAMQDKIRLAVLISGRGANLQALIEAAQQPHYRAKVEIVLSDRPDAGALKRARGTGMPAYAFPADSMAAFALCMDNC